MKTGFILGSIGLALGVSIGHAAVQHSSGQTCVLLGPNPSMIVSFKNQKSSLIKAKVLNTRQLGKLSTAGHVTFRSSRIMSGGSYIVFFDAPTPGLKGSFLQTLRPGCYTPASIDALVNEIKKQPEIDQVSPNALLSVNEQEQADLLAIGVKQWDLAAPPGGIDAQNAWNNFTRGSTNATIAVLDTGILNNTALNGNLKTSGVFFNNLGAFGNGSSPSCDSACSAYNHGTHVGGTIAASGQLAYGENIYGVVPSGTILPVNVFTRFNDAGSCNNAEPCLLAYTSDMINALNWIAGTAFSGVAAAPKTIVGVNMSLGGLGACAGQMQTAFNTLFNKGLSVVISAGNDNADAANYTPASCNGVITVAATGPSGERAVYSNYGGTVNIAAPGGNSINPAPIKFIYSTVENAFAYKQGTSMAAPHVAGLVAMMYSIDPTLDSTRALTILTQGTSVTAFPDAMTVPGGTSSCDDPVFSCGAGIIDAFNTATNTLTQAPALVFNPVISFANISFSGATVSWTPASWAPAQTTSFVYTVSVNNIPVASCTGIATTSCQLTGLAANNIYNIKVSATDFRSIHSPVASTSSQLSTTLTPTITAPVLTSAIRDPMDSSVVYIYFSSLGSIYPGISYALSYAPEGVAFTLDAIANRFVLSNLNWPQSFHTSIQASLGGNTASSSSILVPANL